MKQQKRIANGSPVRVRYWPATVMRRGRQSCATSRETSYRFDVDDFSGNRNLHPYEEERPAKAHAMCAVDRRGAAARLATRAALEKPCGTARKKLCVSGLESMQTVRETAVCFYYVGNIDKSTLQSACYAGQTRRKGICRYFENKKAPGAVNLRNWRHRAGNNKSLPDAAERVLLYKEIINDINSLFKSSKTAFAQTEKQAAYVKEGEKN